ncbi:MAG TPA: ATP synthase F1 subunit gamma [Chitinophagaceae bacterium]|nr:ATP synthase F1 subunit gamma [Chitinophagaceae bacterium]
MSGKLKEVRDRIKTVQSIQQTTKAMKMVSAAELRRAQDAIQQMRPYALKLQEMLGNIIASGGSETEMELADPRPVEKVLLVVITSDRGLCGGYNSNLIKLARLRIREKYPTQFAAGSGTIMAIGKKGFEYFTKSGFRVDGSFRSLFSDLRFEEVRVAAQQVVEGYLKKDYDVVELIYSEFKNAIVQQFRAETFLPVQKSVPRTEEARGGIRADFIYEPDQTAILRELLPKILNTQFYKATLDAHASEHGARMTAMDKATENANDFLKDLRITYNRVRQAAITTELTEIVGGAAALTGR